MSRTRGRRRSGRTLALVPSVFLTVLASGPFAFAEEPAATPRPSLFRDPQDGAVDLSGWLASRTGVLPVPVPITEPAVGYGAALGLIRFHGAGLAGAATGPLGPTGRPIPPGVSFLGGALTENGTWAVVAGHMGYWKGDRWRYKGALGRIAPTLDYYGSNGSAYSFTADGWAVFQELARRVGKTDLFAGLQLAWLDTTVSFELSQLPPEVPRPERDTTEAGLAAFPQYDTRDNSLSPKSGVDVKVSAAFLGSYLGGDHDFERYTGKARLWWDPHPRIVLWARVQAQGVSGDPPFYAYPFVYLRGIPVMRYQGDSVLAVDVEVKWNVWRRWWLGAFAGAGVTDDSPGLQKEGESVNAGGFGFRYLVARSLGLQAGIDVAKGPEEYAVYVVVGSTF